MILKVALHEAILNLQSSSTSARIDAEVLLAFVLKKERNYLYSYPESLLSQSQITEFKNLIAKRIEGLPIAYLIEEREFWSLKLKVTPDTLIPRPETELLVELSLKALETQKNARVLELGTGSGAIALALAKERNDLEIIAVDKSKKALDLAQRNAKELHLNAIQFIYSDWFNNIPKDYLFDLIVSNPPYIAKDDPHLSEGDLRFEPLNALASGKTGLDDIEHIIKHSLARLAPMGLLLLEHGFSQKLAIRSMLNDYGYKKIQSWKDWRELDRVSGGQRLIS